MEPGFKTDIPLHTGFSLVGPNRTRVPHAMHWVLTVSHSPMTVHDFLVFDLPAPRHCARVRTYA